MANLKTYVVLTVLVMGLVFLGIGCTDTDSGEETAPAEEAPADEADEAVSESIDIRGSDTVLPLAQAEAEAFMAQNPDKDISVTGGGSGVGIAALLEGEIDIADASREMKDSEREAAAEKGIEPVEHVVAYDGISVIVHPDNPLDELTYEQLNQIYGGEISNWADVGGEDMDIAVISRDSTSGTYEYFKEEILGDEGEYRADKITQGSNGAIVSEVAQNPKAIGYIGVAYLADSVKAVSVDAGDGAQYPSKENIEGGVYPLARPLLMYTNGEPTGLAKEFIDFIGSEEGQEIVLEVGYFPAP